LTKKLTLKNMTGKTKDYLLKTIVAIILIAVGAWGVSVGGKLNVIFGSICFLIGFIIMAVLYGRKWLWWGSDFFQ
jgi:hypothetical protein